MEDLPLSCVGAPSFDPQPYYERSPRFRFKGRMFFDCGAPNANFLDRINPNVAVLRIT